MIIQTDNAGRAALIDICDLAVKQGGLKVVSAIQEVIRTIQVFPTRIVPPASKPQSPQDPEKEGVRKC